MDLISRDLAHVWHPCMQMKDFEQMPPLEIVSAKGDYLIDASGRQIIDAISSWWCKSLGHGQPQLMEALRAQSHRFEHTILANTTYEGIVTLSERLCALSPSFAHVFYASEGSCAVEIAIKMAVHAQQLRGQPKRHRIVALANGYHGETGLALAASDVGIYRQPYEKLMIQMQFIQDLPYVTGADDPQWQDCGARWPAIEAQLAAQASETAALILEPVMQGAGGMKIYSPDLLRRLRAWCDANDILLIADEIMTGFGRSGKMLACEHADIEADFVCFSKGLTAGVIPLSATVTTEAIYQLFYDDHQTGKAFLHSHTYCGNALAVAVANAVFDVFESQQILAQLPTLQQRLLTLMQQVADNTGRLAEIRSLGAMVAAEITGAQPGDRAGYRLHQEALAHGALIRPLGNTLYWLPPLNVADETLTALADITTAALQK